jgi:hypothetical protein
VGQWLRFLGLRTVVRAEERGGTLRRQRKVIHDSRDSRVRFCLAGFVSEGGWVGVTSTAASAGARFSSLTGSSLMVKRSLSDGGDAAPTCSRGLPPELRLDRPLVLSEPGGVASRSTSTRLSPPSWSAGGRTPLSNVRNGCRRHGTLYHRRHCPRRTPTALHCL